MAKAKAAAETAAKETKEVKEVKEVKEKATATKEKATTAKKSTSKVKEACFVEFNDKQIAVSDLMETAKKMWKESNTGTINSVSVYVKPEESKAYYVVNDTDNGDFDI